MNMRNGIQFSSPLAAGNRLPSSICDSWPRHRHVRHAWLAMLLGFAFLSQQLGGFLGVWLSGVLFEHTQSYDAVWWLAILFGHLSAADQSADLEKPVQRSAANETEQKRRRCTGPSERISRADRLGVSLHKKPIVVHVVHDLRHLRWPDAIRHLPLIKRDF